MANRRELEGNSCAHSGLASITGGPEVLLWNGRLGSSGYSTGGCLWKEGTPVSRQPLPYLSFQEWPPCSEFWQTSWLSALMFPLVETATFSNWLWTPGGHVEDLHDLQPMKWKPCFHVCEETKWQSQLLALVLFLLWCQWSKFANEAKKLYISHHSSIIKCLSLKSWDINSCFIWITYFHLYYETIYIFFSILSYVSAQPKRAIKTDFITCNPQYCYFLKTKQNKTKTSPAVSDLLGHCPLRGNCTWPWS